MKPLPDYQEVRRQYEAQQTAPAARYAQTQTAAAQYPALFTEPPDSRQKIPAYQPARPLSGLLLGVKDTFDEQGKVTTAGSALSFAPAQADAEALRRLKQAGAVPAGRTNMSEFAFSGLGLNPHYGTPSNALDASRIAGGSTSGGAAGVALGLFDAALGTDTGGSLRIPAAFNGVVGFKPSQASVSRQGCFPLSPSLDCAGPIARSVADCALLWQVLSGQSLQAAPMQTLLRADHLFLQDADAQVIAGYEEALARLSQAGFAVQDGKLPALEAVLEVNQQGGLVLPEAAWVHKDLLAAHEQDYDPLIAARIRGGAATPLTDYIERLQRRPVLQESCRQQSSEGLLIAPTVAILPPALADVTASDEAFARYNRLALRNTAVFNYLDAPSISLPFYPAGSALPIGIMLSARQGEDAALLAAAQLAAAALAR